MVQLLSNCRAIHHQCRKPDYLFTVYTALLLFSFDTLIALFVIGARSHVPWVDSRGRPIGSSGATLADAGWSGNWFIFLYWFTAEVLDAVLGTLSRDTYSGQPCNATFVCGTGVLSIMFISNGIISKLGYIFMYLYFVRRAFTELGKKQYGPFRWTHIYLRYDFRTTGWVVFMALILNAGLVFVTFENCASFLVFLYGVPSPLVGILTAFMVADSFLMMPVKPGPDVILQISKDPESWAEQPQGTSFADYWQLDGDDKANPSFCFETATKLCYWCEIAYDYNAKDGSVKDPADMATAMSLYGLKHVEFLKEAALDANALLAWSNRIVLLSSRGTYSTRNLWADLKIWRVAHPPERGSYWLGTQPLVHRGFLQCWISRSFNTRVLESVKRAVKVGGPNMRVLITGHSLGGAVAQLAAFDIKEYCGLNSGQIAVYTFGCPRVGNYAFAEEYEHRIPNTWHVVNNLDAVARSPKLWILYKQTCKRVVINSKGDIIVDPMFLEFKLMSLYIMRVKVADHTLMAYRKALATVLRVQFVEHKGFPGSVMAMQQLLRKGQLTQVLDLDADNSIP